MRESGLFSWKDKGEDDQALQKTSLYSKFRNRVMFPIANEQGKVIAFTGRTLATDEKSGPKYLNSPETTHLLEIARVVQPRQSERSHPQARLRHPGRRSDGLHRRLFRGPPQRHCQLWHSVHRTAGASCWDASAKRSSLTSIPTPPAPPRPSARSPCWSVKTSRSRSLPSRPGSIPISTSARKVRTPTSTRSAQSQKYFDYLIERARALHPVRTPEGKVKALNYLLPHIQRVPSRIVRDELANEICASPRYRVVRAASGIASRSPRHVRARA